MGNPKLRAHRTVEHRQHTTDTGPTRPHLGRGLGVGTALEELVLEGHIALGLEADAGAEDVGESGALLGEGVDDGRAGWRQRCLEHVAQHAQNAVEALEAALRGGARRHLSPLDPRHHLRYEHQVDDQRRGEEGVFTDVEDAVFARLVSKRRAVLDWIGAMR